MLSYRSHQFELVSFPLNLRTFDRVFSALFLRFPSSVLVLPEEKKRNLLVLQLKEVSVV